MKEEILLDKNEKRFTLFPIQHQNLWDWYKIQEKMIWVADEVDLSKDHWEDLNPDEQYFIKHILCFFAASDGIVSENLAVNFAKEVQITEAQYFYNLQTVMENIHAESYSLMIDKYIKDPADKQKCFNALEEIPVIKRKGEWALKWINSPNFAERLLAFICVEGIFFSGSFAAIFWLRKREKLEGLCKYNDFISRDEGLHCDFAIYLYNHYIANKISTERILEIFNEAIELEKQFLTESLSVKLIGMNEENMKQYIDYVSATLLQALNIEVSIPKNPFKFMEQIAVERKTNFFEKRPNSYVKSDSNVAFDEDF